MPNTKARGRTRATVPKAKRPAVRVAPSAEPESLAASKSPAPVKAQTLAAPAAGAGKPKSKLMRDSFTIPRSEYAVLEALKARAVRLARPAKKSELLRAGIAALSAMDDAAFLGALGAVPSLKTGRPKGGPATAGSRPPAK